MGRGVDFDFFGGDMGKAMRWAVVWLVAAVAAWGGAVWASDVVEAEAEGVAFVQGGNTALARSQALDQAIRALVETQVGTLLDSQSLVDNNVLISDAVLSRSRGYVRNYRIVREGRRGPGEYVVRVRGRVERGKVRAKLDDLGLLHALKDKPKLMILVEEKNMGVFGTTGWENVSEAETALGEYFLNKGFNVVDAATVRRNLKRDQALAALGGDAGAAARIALAYGAQLAVVGKAISKNAGGKVGKTSLQSIHATVSARVVRTDSGKIIASASASSAKAHPDEIAGGAAAIRKAADKVGAKLADQIAVQWQKDVYGSAAEVTLTITGLVSYLHLDAVLGFLESGVQGVKAVQQRQYSGGTAEIGVDYAGKTRTLARDLAAKKFKGFRLNPTEVSQNKIGCTVLITK